MDSPSVSPYLARATCTAGRGRGLISGPSPGSGRARASGTPRPGASRRVSQYRKGSQRLTAERAQCEAILGGLLANCFQQRILVGEILIVGKTSSTNLILDYAFHLNLLA
jgi:hypothetical protein